MSEKHTSPSVVVAWVGVTLATVVAIWAAWYSKQDSPATLEALPPVAVKPMNGALGTTKNEEIVHVPSSPNSSTAIYLESVGDRSVLLQEVRLHSGGWYLTPKRTSMIGAVIAVPVVFELKHYEKSAETFRYKLPKPVEVKAGDFANALLTIVIPQRAGQTYRGKASFVFNGTKVVEVDGIVEVDVLKKVPDDITMSRSQQNR